MTIIQKFHSNRKKSAPSATFKESPTSKTKKTDGKFYRRDEESGEYDSAITNGGGDSYDQDQLSKTQSLKILALEKRIKLQELEIMNLKRSHQQNLSDISQALFKLQSSLINKERMLDNIIIEKEQTIQEQQKVIRRLLKKTNSTDSLKQPSINSEDANDLTGSSGVSPANSIPAINEILVSDENNGIMEISFHVPNLREAKLGSRSISGEEKEDKNDKTKTAKIAERLAKKREKLLSMKRCSGYLKRPEILETVYSVEDPDDAGDNQVKLGESRSSDEKEKKEAKDSLDMRDDNIIRGESETTEYDFSTDDESLRLFFSETDQSACCSEICSRRSSASSQPSLLIITSKEDERSRSTEDLIDLRGKMKLVEKRRKMFQQKQSVSLDCGET